MFAVNRAARRFDSLTAQVLSGDGLSFLEGLVLAAMFFEAPRPVSGWPVRPRQSAARQG